MRLALFIGILMIIGGCLLDLYIYFSIPAIDTKGSKWRRKTYGITAIITNFLILTVVCWPKRNANASLLPVMWLLYTWITIYTTKLIICLFSWIGTIPLLFRHKCLPTGKYIGLPLGLIMFTVMWYGAILERHLIDITEVEIASQSLPKAFDGYRIVQFSDAHVGTWGNDTTFIAAVVDSINAQKPDIIVFTGDIVNRKTDEILPFTSLLSRLKAPGGVYSIMGNHDYGDYTEWPTENQHKANTRMLRSIQKHMGWNLLEDEHIWIKRGNDSIALIGVENWGEPPFPSYGDLDKATEGLNSKTFSILLTHNPMHWHMVVREKTDIDLTLSGHTHAMQMRLRLPWRDYSLSSLKYPEWEGLATHRRPNGKISRLYVNIGCGEVGFPARIGAMPEITVITLKCAE